MSTVNINTPANIPSYVMAGNNNFPSPPAANSSFDLTGFLQSFGSSGIVQNGGFNIQGAASLAANAIAPGIGGAVVSLVSGLFGSDYVFGQGWKKWDELDAKYGDMKGGQVFYHMSTILQKPNQSSLEATKADIAGYIQSVGLDGLFNLYLAKRAARGEASVAHITPQIFFNYFNAIGNPNAGKQVANKFSQIAFPSNPLPYPEAEPQPQTTVSPNVGLGGFGDGFTTNNSNNNNDADGSRKKNKWIAPALITVAVIGLMVLAFNAFKNKD